MPRQNLQPEALSTRIVQGHVLYSHVVAVEGRRTIFIAGQLARDRHGKQNLRSPRRNNRRSKQVAQSFLSCGSTSFRLKFSRRC